MTSRTCALAIVAIMAVAMALPMSGSDAETEMFTYASLLDENGMSVYTEVEKESSFDGESKAFDVMFYNNMFDYDDVAKAYADEAVQNALAAEYYSNPMNPYLWNYPVVPVEVVADIGMGTWTEDGVSTSKYYVKSVSFTLTVPEGITEDSMKELEDLLESINIVGNTDKDVISFIITYLDRILFAEDTETHVSNIYDALVKRESSSAGVAAAFSQLCAMKNIYSITVSGANYTAVSETKSYWNYVYLYGQLSDKTDAYAWYIVDAAYCQSIGIAGYLTNLDLDGKTYSMMSTHITDLDLSSPNDLTVPQLNADAYVQPGGLSFLELYGNLLIMGAVVVIIIVAFLMVLREEGN